MFGDENIIELKVDDSNIKTGQSKELLIHIILRKRWLLKKRRENPL